jgi:uncharacterized protein YdaU (DUF1376 family)
MGGLGSMDDDKGKRRVKPLWMPLYIAEFIADTTNLTASQGWAYINLLCAMWRSQDGTLPHDADTLARVGKVHPPRWAKVWEAIKSLFDVDGDRVTSAPLQAELGKAKAIIVTRRAAGSLGGQTTRFNRSMNPVHRNTRSIPKPLISNDAGAAKAIANYNYNIERKKEEEREVSPRPDPGEPSLEEKRASRVVPFETPSTIPQSPSPAGPADSELKRALQDLGENVKLRGGSAR